MKYYVHDYAEADYHYTLDQNEKDGIELESCLEVFAPKFEQAPEKYAFDLICLMLDIRNGDNFKVMPELVFWESKSASFVHTDDFKWTKADLMGPAVVEDGFYAVRVGNKIYLPFKSID